MGTSLLIVPGALALLSWFQQLLLGRTSISAHRPSAVFAAFLGFWTLTSAARVSSADAFHQLRPYWMALVLFLLTQNVLREPTRLVEFGWVVAGSLGLAGAILLLDRVNLLLAGGQVLSAEQFHVAPLITGDPNETGAMVAAGLPFVFYLRPGARTKPNRWSALGLGICEFTMIAGALSTLSITAFLCLITGLASAVAWKGRGAKRAQRLLTIVVVLTVALVSPLGDRVRLQAAEIGEAEALDLAGGRVRAWKVALVALYKAPLLGYGPGLTAPRYQRLSAQYLPREMLLRKIEAGRGPGISPHNMFLSFGAELGIPGLLAFVGLLICVLQPLWWELMRQGTAEAERRALAFLAMPVLVSLLVKVVEGMFLSSHLTDKSLWVFLGAGAALIGLSEES
jgi:O-antigen ligase